ncbi:MAG: GGDEF domain-containing protein [Burkholderiaceae bacterium]
MISLIARARTWFAAMRANGDLVAEEALSGNLRRLRWLVLVVIPLNLVNIAFLWGNSADTSVVQLDWKNSTGWIHLAMAVWLALAGLLAHRLITRADLGARARALEFMLPWSALVFLATLAVVDQLVTPNISPYLIGCVFVGMLVLLRPGSALLLYLTAYVVLFVGLGATQHDAAQLINNRLNGLGATVMGLVLSMVLWQKNTRYVLLQRELKTRNAALLKQQEELVWLAKRDALTGLFNRGEFLRLAEAELLRAQRHRTDTSAIMVDMDYFKNINDVYGHPAGDSVLKHAAMRLLDAVRATDVVARVGGEEFMILLPQTSSESAVALAKKLLNAMRQTPTRVGADLEISATASFGVGTLPAGQLANVAWLYAAADHALYEAKRLGRNRVEKAEAQGALTASDFQRMRRQ